MCLVATGNPGSGWVRVIWPIVGAAALISLAGVSALELGDLARFFLGEPA